MSIKAQQKPANPAKMIKRTFAVFRKDVLGEFRTRYAMNAIFLFAVTTLVAVSFSIGGADASPSVQSALLWIIIYFSALSGLARAFVKEEESHTASALRLAAAPGAVFGGKLLFNFLLLILLELVTVPLFVGMMSLQVKNWPLFIVVTGAGSAGLAVSATIVSTIVSKANAKGALFAVLSFPILLPAIIGGIKGTKAAITSVLFADGMQDVKLLISYTGVMFVVSLLVFRFIWED
ncbi:MAG: heme exporter protein CcmB [Armatimonadota bacterium]